MNILFITADQWRGDAVGYAGHNLVRTPNLDALAGDGVAFLNHYAQAAPCSPARAALYTGLYQMNNRVCRNGSPLSDRFDNVARAARRAGYDPVLFGYTDTSPDPTAHAPGDPDLTTYEGVLPGFAARVKLPEHHRPWLSWLRERGVDLPDFEAANRPGDPDADPFGHAPAPYPADLSPSAFLTGEFIRWLGEQRNQRPWFAHISYLRPHPPFIAPEPYNTMFDPADVGGFVRAPTQEEEAAQHPLLAYTLADASSGSFIEGGAMPLRDLPEAAFRQIKATYYGMIAEVDAQIGRAFEAIKAAGVWDDTLVVFTSDHAELMGDHYLLGKGGYFDGSQHIPLIIRDPAGTLRGHRVEAFTEAVDVFPTLLERIGIAATHHPDGRSLRPFLVGNTPAGWRDAVHWEYDFREVASGAAERWFGLRSTQLNCAVLRTERYKYVHFAALPPLLFDVAADPGSLRNRAGDPAYAPVRLELAERLLAWRAEHLDQSLALKELTAAGVVGAR